VGGSGGEEKPQDANVILVQYDHPSVVFGFADPLSRLENPLLPGIIAEHADRLSLAILVNRPRGILHRERSDRFASLRHHGLVAQPANLGDQP
jgi:hypothetical protein